MDCHAEFWRRHAPPYKFYELNRDIHQSSDFYFYFRVLRISCILLIIFVYLLTINFVLVLIDYFQNIVYSCITINFTVSYVKIAHKFILLYSRHVQLQYIFTFVTLYEFACTCAVYSTFLNASTDTVSYTVRSLRDQNLLSEGKGQNPVLKILLITGIICNFISIQDFSMQTFWIFKT